jgi:hypothetical protein
VTIISAGTCTLRASQPGSATYHAANDVVNQVVIEPAVQRLAFPAPSSQPLAGSPLALAATATSGLPVTFASQTPAVCTTAGVNGNTVTMAALGNCTIRASQAGNGNYVAATPVDRSFGVTQAVTQLTLTSSANIAAFGAPLALTANARGANPAGIVDFIVTYASATGTVTTPLCSGVPLVAGAAGCHVPGGYQKVSPLYFQVSYGGDTNNTSAGTSLLQMVSLSRSTLTVTAAPRLPVAGRSLTLTALVIQQGLGSVVSFHEHGAVLAGCSAVALSPVGGSADSGVGTCRIDALTAGSHTYVATVPSPAGSGFEQVSVVVDVVANGPLDYSDLWWGGAAENGWGVSVTQHGNTQFVVLFVYDNAGNPVWYVLPGGNWNDTANAYSGVLYRPTSSPRTAYDVSKFNSNAPVGSATITYTSDSTALFSYTIDGISGSKQIVRQPYAGDDGKARLVVNDMWWAGSQENGWGLSIDQNGPMLFPVWYTYDAAGKATFYAVPGGTWNGTTFTGDIYHPTSSAWLGVPYDARAFNPNRVGTMSLTFIDQDTAMMTYTIDGASGTSTLIRQPY